MAKIPRTRFLHLLLWPRSPISATVEFLFFFFLLLCYHCMVTKDCQNLDIHSSWDFILVAPNAAGCWGWRTVTDAINSCSVFTSISTSSSTATAATDPNQLRDWQITASPRYMSLNRPLPLRPVLLLGPLPTAAGHVSANKLAKTCVTRYVADKTARAR